MDNQKLIDKQINQLICLENKMLNKKDNEFIKQKRSIIASKIDNMIPDKAVSILETAFEKGFRQVFEKGTSLIEKSYNVNQLNEEFDINQYRVERSFTVKNLKRFEKQVHKMNFKNELITVAEGGILGVLGIGVPDIPIFIGMILKTIYEISLSYGFDYSEENEKIFILYIICTALSNEYEKLKYSKLTDKMSSKIDFGEYFDVNKDECMEETCRYLSKNVVGAKAVQGIPIIGIAGAFTNYSVINKVSKMAFVKYKKRYLMQLKSK